MYFFVTCFIGIYFQIPISDVIIFYISNQDYGDPSAYPPKLDEFLGKKFLFKLKVNDERFSKADPKYIVMRMSDKENLIDQYNLNKVKNEV